MIQFFIENQEVVLPDDFSFTQIDENPLITNNGEFTLDITVSLRNEKNAKAVKFINRINKIDIDTSYNALALDDGKFKYGTVIIQSHTNTDMTFQFVAGNSELNYLAKNDKKIWELDWGTESEIDYTRALQSINQDGYGSVAPGFQDSLNFVCAPVLLGDEIVNQFTIKPESGTIQSNGGIDNMWGLNGISGKIIMQPYLMYYVRKLPELLGYTLGSNSLINDLRAKKMYIINPVDSLIYADSLPDMTISEFIDAIEIFFNVIFVVDSTNKSISIKSMSESLSEKKIVSDAIILDSYSRNFSEDSKAIKFDFTKISYDLPGSKYFKYQCLSEDLKSKCQIKTFQNFADIYTALYDGYTLKNKMIIYRDNEFMNDYFIGKATEFLYTKYVAGGTPANLIDKFCSVGESDKRELVLKIVPCAMTKKTATQTWTQSGVTDNFTIYYQLPVSSSEYFIQKEIGFVDSVENGIEGISRLSTIEVALFTGKIRAYCSATYMLNENIAKYPFSHVDTYPDMGTENDLLQGILAHFESWKTTYYSPAATTSMRIKGAGGILQDYLQRIILDTKIEYEFEIQDSPNITADKIFEYNNQKYLPISLERKKSRKKGLVKGKLYRML